MIDLIGNTPLYLDPHLSNLAGCTVSVKADYQNPGMSSKDRPALFMIQDAIQRGLLQRGDTVVEASSGNTAIGLAMVCQTYGLKCHFFISRKCSDEKKSILRQFGAEITACTSSGDEWDPESPLGKARLFAENHPSSFFCNQYANKANSAAHYQTTGPEIWRQTKGKVTHFIAGIGTGGTITGVGRYLKSQNPAVKVLGVDPVGSVLYDYFRTGSVVQPEGSCTIEGIGRTFLPAVLGFDCIDDVFRVGDAQAVEAAYSYRESTGYLTGFSSAAVLASLLEHSDLFETNNHVVLFFADHGSRYASKLYNPAWLAEHVPDCRIPHCTAKAQGEPEKAYNAA
jgi:cystathionine beta-synthase